MSAKKEFSSRPFEKLRTSIERRLADAVPPVQKKKEKVSDEDLFNSEMDDVQVIEAFRALTVERSRTRPAATLPVRPDPDRAALLVLDQITTGELPMHLPDTQEYLEWTNPDYYDAIIPKLHEGQFSVQASLDLHGCTVSEAEAELDDFLEVAFKRGFGCIKIIHGRGLRSLKGPRIKAAVARRLSGRYRKNIIAYVTARQCDGGLGALYVLLKNKSYSHF